MYFAVIVLLSLILQCIAVYYSFRLTSITGHTKTWMFLSIGIATMAMRRLITLITLLSSPATNSAMDFAFEVIGVLGSAIMLVGLILIKPVFSAVKHAEEEQRSLAERLQDALNNIRVLKGMLPICAHCNKIRDDNGYWQNVESYISENSDTQFSHGICPDCLKKLYPEYSDETPS